MSGIRATLSRELRAYLFSPMAYVVLTFLLVITGAFFAIIVSYLADPRFPGARPLDLFFNMSWLVLLVAVPLITMRLLAEERRSGSIEVLMTAPVSETQVVVGKYLAALLFYILLWLPTLAYAIVIDVYSEIDWGTVAAGYLGLVLIGATLLSVGLFASATAKNQIVAAIITFAFTVLFFFVFGWLEGLTNSPRWKEIFGYLDILSPMQDFAKGIVDTRSLVYALSTTLFFLFLTSRTLAGNKWR